MNTYKKNRLALGLTQEELAEKLGLDRSTVASWELEINSPRLETLIQLAKIFNCTLDDLARQEKQIAEYEAESKEDV